MFDPICYKGKSVWPRDVLVSQHDLLDAATGYGYPKSKTTIVVSFKQTAWWHVAHRFPENLTSWHALNCEHPCMDQAIVSCRVKKQATCPCTSPFLVQPNGFCSWVHVSCDCLLRCGEVKFPLDLTDSISPKYRTKLANVRIFLPLPIFALIAIVTVAHPSRTKVVIKQYCIFKFHLSRLELIFVLLNWCSSFFFFLKIT